MTKKQEIKMTELFKGYTNYSEKEYKRIWSSSLIVVDTNILLNFYRYSEDTKREMFKILTSLKDRLWIPYQIAKEYFKNKNNVMVSSYDEYTKLSESINALFESSLKEINARKNSQLKCKSEIVKILEESSKNIDKILLNEKESKKPTFENNEIEKKIIQLFNKSIGSDFSDEEYEKIKKEGKRRVENKIPPGYKDEQKNENGDYYIFYSLIKQSKNVNKDIIFITDDVKEDWFNKVNGEKHGGRYELLNEFYNETGNLLMIYTSDGFAKAYNKNIAKQELNNNFLNELVSVRHKSGLRDNYIKYIEIYPNSIYELKKYRDYLVHNFDDFDKEKFLHDLRIFIESMHIPLANKINFIKVIDENKNKFLENDFYDKEIFISIIDKILSFCNRNSTLNRININYDEINHVFRSLISDIYLSQTSEQLLKVYIKVQLNLKLYIQRLEKVDYTIYSRLCLAFDLTQELINNKVTSVRGKRKLVDLLSGIVELLENKSDMPILE